LELHKSKKFGQGLKMRSLLAVSRLCVLGMKQPSRSLHTSTASLLAGESGGGGGHRPDYYQTLEISRWSSGDDIKVAYFRMARKYHPDTNKTREAQLMFALCAEAYEILSDPDKRDVYDRTGKVMHRTGGTTSKGPDISQSQDSTDSEKLFSKIFGKAKGRRMADDYENEGQHNDNTYYGFDAAREIVVNVTFDQAAMGASIPVALNIRVVCPKCDGDRSELGYQANICPYCEGTGLETERIGDMVARKTCSYCDGTKLFVRFKCHECAGTGQTIRIFPQHVDVPAGCENGQILRVPIIPEILQYTANHHDHFYAKVTVDEHPLLTRVGLDVYSQVDVSLAQAVLGGELFVAGINDSTVILDVGPELDASHKTLVAPNKGVPSGGGGLSGSHFVEVGVKVPARLSRRERAQLVQVFRAFGPPDNGLVDGCDEPDYAHKLKVGVIEPSKVTRNFAKAQISMKERVEKEERMKRAWSFDEN